MTKVIKRRKTKNNAKNNAIKRKIGTHRNFRLTLDYERSRSKANIQEMLELTEMQFSVFKDIVSVLKHSEKELWVKDIVILVSDEGHTRSIVEDITRRMLRAKILNREDRGAPLQYTSGPTTQLGHNFAEALDRLYRAV